MERTYCGLKHDQMSDVLTKLCEIENSYEENEDGEIDALQIAIQCVTDIMNMMTGDGINWEHV